MYLFKSVLGAMAVLTVISAPAVATVIIDFEGLPYTDCHGLAGDVIPDAASVLADSFMSDGVLFGSKTSAGVAVEQDSSDAPSSGLNSVVGLDVFGSIPGTESGGRVGDIFFSFVLPGTRTPAYTDYVSFTIGDAGYDLDVFEIRSYNLADELIDIRNVSDTSRFLVAISVPEIHRVEIDFSGDFGYSLDDLTFTSPVPEPCTLMMFGLVGLAALIKRRP
jgi:hypothetical protein